MKKRLIPVCSGNLHLFSFYPIWLPVNPRVLGESNNAKGKEVRKYG